MKWEAIASLIMSIIIEAVLFVPMGKVWTELFDAIFKIGEILDVELPLGYVIAVKAVEFCIVYFIVFLIISLIIQLFRSNN